MHKRPLLLILFLINAFAISAQIEIKEDLFTRFQNLTTRDGLSNNHVLDICQDKHGFIWIATTDGLNRYDGYSFKIYRNQPEDSTSISDNFITCIEEDKSGNLWIGTKNGFNKYDPLTNSFIRHLYNPEKNSISHNHVRQIMADGNILWIETLDGVLNKFIPDDEDFYHYAHDKIKQPYYYYHSIYKDRQENIWIGGRSLGPLYLDTKKNNFTEIKHGGNNAGKKRDRDVACYFEDSYGTFWVSATDGIYKYDRQSNWFEKFLGTSTFDIKEDSKHRIWFGSGYGLYEYQPQTGIITQYQSIENNPFSLVDNNINKLLIDNRQNLWIATKKGISILSYFQNRFQHIYHIPGLKNTPISNKISALHQDRDGNIWIGSLKNGISIYNQESGEFKHIQHSKKNNTLSSNRISCFMEDKGGQMWAGLWQGVGFNKIDKKTDKATRYAYSYNTRKSDWYSDLLQTEDGNLWLGIWGAAGLHKFDPQSGKIQGGFHTASATVGQNEITAIEIVNGEIWMGSNRHCFNSLNIQTKVFSVFYSKNAQLWNKKNFNYLKIPEFHNVNSIQNTKKSLIFTTDSCIFDFDPIKKSGRSIFCTNGSNPYSCINHAKDSLLITDKNNIYLYTINNRKKIKLAHLIVKPGKVFYAKNHFWISSAENQLNKISINNNSVQITEYKNAISHKINNIFENKKELIVITEGGIYLSQNNQELQRVSLDPNTQHLNILSAGKYKNGYLLGTSNGLYQYHVINKTIEKFKLTEQQNILDELKINGLKIDGKMLYLASHKGLFAVNLEHQRIFPFNKTGNDRLISHLTTCLLEDHKHNIWQGTSNKGISVYNPKTEYYTHYTAKENDASSISANAINCIFQDSKKRIWIGTNGLNLYDSIQKKFTTFKTEDGLPNNNITGILEDNNGNLWIGTSYGLSCFNPENSRFQNFFENDGLQGNEFTGAHFKLKDGKLCFAGNNGFNIIDPDKLLFNAEQPTVHISDFKMYNHSVGYDFTETKRINLKHDENFFSIEFSSLDFSSVKNNTYKYRLKGVDHDWVETNSNSATYTKVAPGNYTFEVYGSNNDGIRSKEPALLEISISHPFYAKKWFLSILSLIIILIALNYIRLSKAKVHFLEEKNETEQKMLRTQMNPHFIFNSLIAIQGFIYKGNKEEASRYLSNFSKLMRLNLNNLREAEIPLTKELETIKYYLSLQMLRFDQKFSYHIEIGKNIKTGMVMIPPMLIQPFVENSIEHGLLNSKENGHIEIKIKIDEKILNIEISDNGIGIDASIKRKNKESVPEHSSLATTIVKQRLQHFGKLKHIKTNFDITNKYDEKGNNLGTLVSLSLPFSVRKQF